MIPHLGHLIGHVSAVEPTAQAEGNTEYWECDRCGLVLADAGLAQVIEKSDTVLPKLEESAPVIPMQPMPPTAQQVVLAPLSLLPKTGDDSQVIEKSDTVLPKLEESAPVIPMQPMPPTAQQVVLAPLSLLPKTGDDSAIPVVIMGVIGAIAVVAGIVVKMRGKSK